MSSVSTVSNMLGVTPGNASSSAPAGQATQSLGINDFMKLLATQFQEQDPLQPMDDTAFIAQTAQFTSLQQTTTLTQNMSQMAANTYIGREVTVNSLTGQTAIGTVTGVDTTGTTPQVIVNGAEYPITNILGITSAPVAPPATGAPSTASGSGS
jgi:flagellar basal-body rod modification protein FlgD